MPPLLAAVAVGLAAASIALPRSLAKKALLEKKLAVEEVAPEARMFSDGKGRRRHFKNPEQARAQALPALHTSVIIGMALAEAIAVNGFVLLLLGFEYSWGLPFFGVAWVLMLGRFPSSAKLDQQIEDAYDADLKVPANDPTR
jgi:F0F1-type ATP synthase membrane subunit c/vacuolar-type H+-ATPase subunit K